MLLVCGSAAEASEWVAALLQRETTAAELAKLANRLFDFLKEDVSEKDGALGGKQVCPVFFVLKATTFQKSLGTHRWRSRSSRFKGQRVN
jgi:hypothetical protein